MFINTEGSKHKSNYVSTAAILILEIRNKPKCMQDKGLELSRGEIW